MKDSAIIFHELLLEERILQAGDTNQTSTISTDTLHKQREVCGLQLVHHLEQVEAQVVHSAAILVLNFLARYTSADVEESLDTETGDEATCCSTHLGSFTSIDKELLPSPTGTFTLANFFINFIQLIIFTSYF